MPENESSFKNPIVTFTQSVFRGIGQSILSGNALSGALIIAGVAYSSWQAAIWFVVGAALATIVARWMETPKELVDIGMFGLGGGYTGVIVGTFIMQRVPHAPGGLFLLVIFSSVVIVPITMAWMLLFVKANISCTALPVITIVWLVLAGFLHGGVYEPPANAPEKVEAVKAVSESFTWETVVFGTLSAFGQVFMHGNPISGGLILLGVLVNSRIMGAMGVGTCLMICALGWYTGVPADRIGDGELLFNGMLTAMGLAGFFLYLDYRSVIYALFAAVLAQLVYIAAVVVLKPTGLPAMVIGFVVVNSLFTLAAPGLGFVKLVPMEKLSKPENSFLKSADVLA